MRRGAVWPLLVLLGAVSLGGCASDATATESLPVCADGDDGTATNGVILMAQSVPSASWIPCLRTTLPLGWGFFHLAARDGEAHFWLDSDRDGTKAIEVSLEPSCDTTGTTRIASDREDMQRFERVRMTTPRYEGERYYVFDGGCITFTFRLRGQSRGEPLALATQSVGAISRDALLEQVREDSNGRLSLDPAGEGTG